MNFGEKLYKLRTENGLTQSELGEEIGVSKQMISRYEKGLDTPSINGLKLIAEKFNVSTDYLVGVKKQKEKSK